MPGKRSTRQKLIRQLEGVLTRLGSMREDLLEIAHTYEGTTGESLAAALLIADNGLEVVQGLLEQIREQM